MGFAFLREIVVKNLLFGWVGSFFPASRRCWTTSGRYGTTRTAACTT